MNNELKDLDLILLQEHWLYAFEKVDIMRNLENWHSEVRSVDEYDNISPVGRSPGQGGVGTLCKPWLIPFKRTSSEGNQRIMPLILGLPNRGICILNCYLPSGNSTSATTTFEADIALLKSLVSKYSGTHEVIVAGDLNADIFNRSCRKEELLKDFIKESLLYNLNKEISLLHTFHHKSFKGSKSHLDYILYSGQQVTSGIRVIENKAINSSGHSAVSVCIHGIPRKLRKSTTAPITFTRKVKWEEGNQLQYKAAIDTELAEYNLDLLKLPDVIRVSNNILLMAESSSYPATKPAVQRGLRKQYCPELAEAVAASKAKHFLWKQAGEPGTEHQLSVDRRRGSREVRAVQRKHKARGREKLYTDVMESFEGDRCIFYKLLKNRHGTAGTELALKLDGRLEYDPDIQREAWAIYCEGLANPKYDEEGRALVTEALRWLHSADNSINILSADDIKQAVRRLNSGKAADTEGLQAEHLKFASDKAMQVLANIINRIFREKKIPIETKAGYKMLIPKKGKDLLEQSSHRGITVTALLGKLIEHVLLDIGGSRLRNHISQLQFGFEQGKSPAMATLCLSEAAAHARDTKQQPYVTTLDAVKAFDVVNHNLLKQKLHHSGIRGQLWSMLDDLYLGCTESVKWRGALSRSYQVNQGVRQGGIASTSLYKEYINILLVDMEKAGLGLRIGDIYLGIPTCADDVLLISSLAQEMQAMMDTTSTFSTENLYDLHPVKSSLIQLIGSAELSLLENKEWSLGERPIPVANSLEHLGLTWKAGQSVPDVKRKIDLANRTAYMLIGFGLHGNGGINPIVSNHIVNTQVLPRMLYGLEATVLLVKHTAALYKCHKSLIHQYQSLPERTASEAIFLLLGTLPAESHMHLRTLTLFGNICRLQQDAPLRRLALRQLAGLLTSHSWFVHVRNIAAEYGIDLVSACITPWGKENWKRYIKEIIRSKSHINLLQEAAAKSSLKYLDLNLCIKGKPHPIWHTCLKSLGEVHRATFRAKMLVGTYMLQETE